MKKNRQKADAHAVDRPIHSLLYFHPVTFSKIDLVARNNGAKYNDYKSFPQKMLVNVIKLD